MGKEWAITARLRACYWPSSIFGIYTLENILAAPVQADFIPERERFYGGSASRRTREKYYLWNRGRVHYFMKLLSYGEELSPVLVESRCDQYRVGSPISWGPPHLDDGHHRFAASVFARKRYVLMSFGGVVSTKDWLQGKTRRPPPEVADYII